MYGRGDLILRVLLVHLWSLLPYMPLPFSLPSVSLLMLRLLLPLLSLPP